MNTNHKNITKYWDALEGYAGDDLKQDQFKTFLICELSGDIDELQFKLAIERAKIDMRSKSVTQKFREISKEINSQEEK